MIGLCCDIRIILMSDRSNRVSDSVILYRLEDRDIGNSNTQPTHLMPTLIHRILGVVCITIFAQSLVLQAAPENKQPNMEKALHDLQDAKQSKEPIPLVEEARKTLKHATHNKDGFRLDAIAQINKAIDDAKAGDMEKMRQKADAAIANLHAGMSKSH